MTLAWRLLRGYVGASHAPTGVITVGAIRTITDDTFYNAWPSICRMADGRLLLVYTKATTHHQDNSGKAVGRIAATDADAIAGTWGAEFTIYDDASLWSSIMGIAPTSTGRLIATLWRDDQANPGTGEAGIVYSDDNGATWSSWIALTNGFTQEAYGAGPAVELPNGDLLVTIEGSNSGQSLANRSSHTVTSTDDGATWGGEVTVRNYVTDTRPYYESKLLRLTSTTYLCIHRCSANAGLPHYISTSTDTGATWGVPVSEFAGYAAPSTSMLANGVLVVATRKDSDASVIAYSSLDLGTTWSAGTVVDATMFEMEYACPLQLTDGRVLLVYGYQPTSSTSNSDIKQAILTVG